jgi:DNA-binding PadR family transcriptional regulator
MTKLDVLRIFAQSNGFLKPDSVRLKLRPAPNRRSLYSYLGRLKGQGLLERNPISRRGYLSYRITERGRARIEYLRRQLQNPS